MPAYSNRTDLQQQGVKTGPSETYGDRVSSERSQQQMPLPQVPGPVPGERGSFLRPSENPAEPVTAGLPLGPGPGPEVTDVADDGGYDVLAAAFRAFPSESLRRLLLERQVRR